MSTSTGTTVDHGEEPLSSSSGTPEHVELSVIVANALASALHVAVSLLCRKRPQLISDPREAYKFSALRRANYWFWGLIHGSMGLVKEVWRMLCIPDRNREFGGMHRVLEKAKDVGKEGVVLGYDDEFTNIADLYSLEWEGRVKYFECMEYTDCPRGYERNVEQFPLFGRAFVSLEKAVDFYIFAMLKDCIVESEPVGDSPRLWIFDKRKVEMWRQAYDSHLKPRVALWWKFGHDVQLDVMRDHAKKNRNPRTLMRKEWMQFVYNIGLWSTIFAGVDGMESDARKCGLAAMKRVFRGTLAPDNTRYLMATGHRFPMAQVRVGRGDLALIHLSARYCRNWARFCTLTSLWEDAGGQEWRDTSSLRTGSPPLCTWEHAIDAKNWDVLLGVLGHAMDHDRLKELRMQRLIHSLLSVWTTWFRALVRKKRFKWVIRLLSDCSATPTTNDLRWLGAAENWDLLFGFLQHALDRDRLKELRMQRLIHSLLSVWTTWFRALVRKKRFKWVIRLLSDCSATPTADDLRWLGAANDSRITRRTAATRLVLQHTNLASDMIHMFEHPRFLRMVVAQQL